jgi:hypothetical protein
MEDGKESDDIEEATSDDEGQSLRTRARLRLRAFQEELGINFM